MLTLLHTSYRESLDNITVVIVRFISDGTMETSNEGAERADDEETDEMTVLVDELSKGGQGLNSKFTRRAHDFAFNDEEDHAIVCYNGSCCREH